MAPSQPSDGNKGKVAVEKEDKCFFEKSDEKGMSCVSSCEEAMSGMEAFLEKHTKAPGKIDEVEADIIECTNASKARLPETQDPDETEYSSSFGDTVSGAENCSGLSEAEVESQFCEDNGLAFAFDALNDTFHPRKKLTKHWRHYIRPLMWRCKWAELRMMEVESQALNYARELAKFDQGKLSYAYQFAPETSGSKSLPFSLQYNRKKAMKRRKRKRVEDISDVASYMLQHNLFSSLESKRADADGFSTVEDFGNPVATDQNVNDNEFGINDGLSSLDSKNRQNLVEQVLLKIELVQSRIHKLRTQSDNLMSKHDIKFSSSENLSLGAPCDAQTSCAPSPNFSVGNGDALSVGPIYPTQYDFEDLVVSSHGEAVPDFIENTTEFLTSAGNFNIGNPCEDIADDALIHNQRPEIDMDPFAEITNWSMEKHHQETGGAGEQVVAANALPDLVVPSSMEVTQEQSNLESSLVSEFHVPMNKRKRGERKAGSGVWSRRGSVEPDSQ